MEGKIDKLTIGGKEIPGEDIKNMSFSEINDRLDNEGIGPISGNTGPYNMSIHPDPDYHKKYKEMFKDAFKETKYERGQKLRAKVLKRISSRKRKPKRRLRKKIYKQYGFWDGMLINYTPGQPNTGPPVPTLETYGRCRCQIIPIDKEKNNADI